MHAKIALSIFFVYFVTRVECSSSVTSASDFYCENTIGSGFFSRCRMQYPFGLWTNLAQVIHQFADPRALAIFTVCLTLILPLIILDRKPGWRMIQKYYFVRLNVLNFLHRVGYTLIFSIALMGFFKQSCPCRCPVGKEMTFIGPRYGMPNMEAMAAGILSGYLIDEVPYFNFGSQIIGVTIIVWICMERIVLGFASLGQVIIGATIGVILHFYSTRVPQYMIFVDALIQTTAAIVVLRLDPNLTFSPGDPSNLNAWLAWGLAFEIFACLMIWRQFQDNSPMLSLSLNTINDEMRKYETGDGPRERDFKMEKYEFRSASDVVYTLASFFILLLILFLAACIAQYNWFG